jgi:ankyrin repeat protein
MDVFDAIEKNNFELFCKLVNRENVTMLDLSNRSLLRAAMHIGRVDFIQHLIRIGADVNYKNDNWWPPLLKATSDCNITIMEILLNAGADVKYANIEGCTPLGYAFENNRFDCAKLLIDRGAYKHLSERDKGNITYASNRATVYNKWRSKLRRSIMTLIALRKQKKGPLWFIKQDNHVIKMIGKHIWSLRMLEQTTP